MNSLSSVFIFGASLSLLCSVGCSQIQGPAPLSDQDEVLYWHSTPDSRAERAFLAYRNKAERGDSFAQFILGEAYFLGFYRNDESAPGVFSGIIEDHEHAFFWYNKSAKSGLAVAQYKLGILYQYGDGVAKDLSKAAVWFRKASKQGNLLAHNRLGLCYAYGLGVDKNPTEAYAYRILAGPTMRTKQTALLTYGSQGRHEGDGCELDFYWEAAGGWPSSSQTNPFLIMSWVEKLSPEQIAAGKARADQLQEEIDKGLGKIKIVK